MKNFTPNQFGKYGAKLLVKSLNSDAWELIGQVEAWTISDLKQKARQHAQTWGKHEQGRILMICVNNHEFQTSINPEVKPNAEKKIIAEFTAFPKFTNWVTGRAGDYIFQAKLYDTASQFGINEGRITLLWVWTENKSGTVFEYDKKWVKKPQLHHKKLFHAIMELLENSEPRFN